MGIIRDRDVVLSILPICLSNSLNSSSILLSKSSILFTCCLKCCALDTRVSPENSPEGKTVSYSNPIGIFFPLPYLITEKQIKYKAIILHAKPFWY
jgi:hypothetical protein